MLNDTSAVILSNNIFKAAGLLLNFCFAFKYSKKMFLDINCCQ